MFRDCEGTNDKRREIFLTAISFMLIFAVWLAVVLIFGFQPLSLGMSYDETVLVVGLGVLVACAAFYLVEREREERSINAQLVERLQDTVESLDERVRQLDGLCTVSARLAGALRMDDIAQAVLDGMARELFPGCQAQLVLLDRETGRVVYARSSRAACSTSATNEEVSPPLPVSVADKLDNVEEQIRAWNERCDLISAILPLKEGLLGLLIARRQEAEEPYREADRGLLLTLANMAAKALESAQVHADLRESYLATVRSLIRSLHARDNYAAAHSERVASLAIRLAEQIGLAESAIKDLEAFAPLHDVGKIGIRDAILLKRTPLTDREKTICRQHCVIGDRIIRPLRPSREALALVRNHHESWNGTGYPDGLAGEAIPLLARVVKVADCFDALVSERPYGPVLSEAEAISHFRLRAGEEYDSAVVEALAAVLRGDAPGGEQACEQVAFKVASSLPIRRSQEHEVEQWR